jgi:hypothetical protein
MDEGLLAYNKKYPEETAADGPVNKPEPATF